MIGQIGYLGKVSPRTGILTSLAYMTGITLGSTLLGFAVGATGFAVRWLFDIEYRIATPAMLLPIAVVAMLGGLHDLGFISVRLPGPTTQLPRFWMDVLGPYKTGFLWGFFVGLAQKTRVGYSLYYVMILWILLVGSPVLGALVMATYGLTNGLLLVTEVTALAMGRADPEYGLLPPRRNELFFGVGGAVLMACGVFLFALCGLAH
jgi:hypothetical protein